MQADTHNIVSPSNPAIEEPTLEELRSAVGDAVKRQYGAVKAYAIRLCKVLPAEWYEVEHTDVTEEAKPVLEEAKKFRDSLREAGHKNPSVVWTRVREEGKAHIEGAPEKDGKKKDVRSFQRRLIEDLPLIYRAGKKEKSLSTQQQQVMTHLASAITALGLDLSAIVK